MGFLGAIAAILRNGSEDGTRNDRHIWRVDLLLYDRAPEDYPLSLNLMAAIDVLFLNELHSSPGERDDRKDDKYYNPKDENDPKHCLYGSDQWCSNVADRAADCGFCPHRCSDKFKYRSL